MALVRKQQIEHLETELKEKKAQQAEISTDIQEQTKHKDKITEEVTNLTAYITDQENKKTESENSIQTLEAELTTLAKSIIDGKDSEAQQSKDLDDLITGIDQKESDLKTAKNK